jgi:hypothetical protein
MTMLIGYACVETPPVSTMAEEGDIVDGEDVGVPLNNALAKC